MGGLPTRLDAPSKANSMKRSFKACSILLFDMGGTFMFNNDRFGPEEDFHRTYQAVGGEKLSSNRVNHLVRACFDGMSRDYNDPERFEDFPTLGEGFRQHTDAPTEEIPWLKEVFSHHEFGSVSESHASLLSRLAQSRRLGLVSNIWSAKSRCLSEFARAGIATTFSHLVFSSDFRSIKPSPFLFKEALRGLSARPDEAAFIGDDLRRDIEPAKRLGMMTVWTSAKAQSHPAADFVLADIQGLETLLEGPTV